MLSIKKFDDWLNKSTKDNKIIYYRGFMFAPSMQKLSPTLDERRVRNLRHHVHKAYDRGVITLLQKKHDDLDYEYIAVRL